MMNVFPPVSLNPIHNRLLRAKIGSRFFFENENLRHKKRLLEKFSLTSVDQAFRLISTIGISIERFFVKQKIENKYEYIVYSYVTLKAGRTPVS